MHLVRENDLRNLIIPPFNNSVEFLYRLNKIDNFVFYSIKLLKFGTNENRFIFVVLYILKRNFNNTGLIVYLCVVCGLINCTQRSENVHAEADQRICMHLMPINVLTILPLRRAKISAL